MTTPNRADLSLLHALATSGLDVMQQMPLLADCLRRLVPSFSLSLMRVDDRCVPHAHYSEHFDAWSHHAFAEHAHLLASSPGDPASFGTLLRSRRPYGNLIGTRPEYVAGTIYQQMFARNGIHHCMDVAVRTRTRPLGILGLFREKGTRPFHVGDVAVVASIYDALVHAYEAPSLAGPLDEAGGAIIVADRNGSIEWASPDARRWLEDATVGSERASLMARAELPAICRELALRLASPRRSRDAGAPLPEATLPVPGGQLRLRAYLLEALTTRDGSAPRIAIQLTLEVRRELRVLAALARATLTPQQRRLAFGIWRRASPATIAAELRVSAATLKSYRKELYVRLGVTSAAQLQAALDALAASTRLDLDRHRPATRAGAVPGST